MAGDFSKTRIQKIQLKAEKMYKDAAAFSDLEPQADAAVIVASRQTAKFQELDKDGKKNKVAVSWIKTCDIVVQDCTTDCELTGPELDTDAKEYEYDLCKEVGFSVDATKTETDIYNEDELIARGLNAARKALDEWYAQMMLIKIKSFAGINQYPQPFTYDPAINATVVPDAMYGDPMGTTSGFRLPTIFDKQMMLNNMKNVYYIDNGRLYLDYQNSLLVKTGSDGASIATGARAAKLDVNFDMVNFNRAGITDATTFAIAKSAIAFRTKTKWNPTPQVLPGKVQQTVWTIPSLVIPGVSYDVYYQFTCEVIGGETHYKHTYKVKTRGGIWLNPEACPVTVGGQSYKPTGIITYVSDAEIEDNTGT